jgi:RNAse (barnase) inhibitor barstar
MPKPVFEIDGSRCTSLDAFYAELDRVLGLADWGHNLNAFNDILRGGFGTPEGGFVLRWANADAARAGLGYPATVAYLEPKLGRFHPTNIPSVQADLEAARRGEGQTLFDILLEILAVHGPTGAEHGDGIDVELA